MNKKLVKALNYVDNYIAKDCGSLLELYDEPPTKIKVRNQIKEMEHIEIGVVSEVDDNGKVVYAVDLESSDMSYDIVSELSEDDPAIKQNVSNLFSELETAVSVFETRVKEIMGNYGKVEAGMEMEVDTENENVDNKEDEEDKETQNDVDVEEPLEPSYN